MSNLLDNINKGIAELHPYEPGRSIDEVVAEYKPDKVVKLASNENPLGPSPKAADILSQANNLHLYPDGDSKKLKSLSAFIEKSFFMFYICSIDCCLYSILTISAYNI